MTEVPVSTVDLVLKQVNLDDLGDLGAAAMQAAFEPFMGWKPSEDVIKEALNATSAMLGGVKVKAGATTQRRFAGDTSLSRGRYYSISRDDEGNDAGTLQHELVAYFYPKDPGWMGIIDLTLPDNRPAGTRLDALASREPSILITFHPLDGQPHAFAARYTNRAAPLLVSIPLRVIRERISGVLDLRLPSTAAWFTKQISGLTFQGETKRMSCFPLKRPLRNFRSVIPTLLEQHLGGGLAFCSLAGIYLRKLGVSGLIYPSARADSFVKVDRNRIVESSGWNFVDYRQSKPPATDVIIDLDHDWPSKVGMYPTAFDRGFPPTPYEDVRLVYRRKGSAHGTWSVSGLQRWQEAMFRSKSVDSVVKARWPKDYESIMRTLWSQWFLVIPAAGELLGRADMLFGAFLGEQECLATVTQWIANLRTGGHEHLAHALEMAAVRRPRLS
jgi:hypothetical protein